MIFSANDSWKLSATIIRLPHIVTVSTPFKIVGSWIANVVILVAHLHSFRSWSAKGFCYKLVNINQFLSDPNHRIAESPIAIPCQHFSDRTRSRFDPSPNGSKIRYIKLRKPIAHPEFFHCSHQQKNPNAKPCTGLTSGFIHFQVVSYGVHPQLLTIVSKTPPTGAITKPAGG